jgi:tetratricopeptide (TPR) repeat protein
VTTIRIAARWAFALLLGASAAAQSEWVLGRDDTQFARRLFEENFADLAEGLLRTIEAKGPGANEMLEVTALGFELRLDKVRREPDFPTRMEALKKLIEEEKAFIQANARTSVADLVRANLPSVYLEIATTLTAGLTKEPDAAKRAELTAEGHGIFEEAKQWLRERIERFAQILRDQTGDQDYALRQHMIASYNLARMDFQHAALYPAGSPERKELLETARSEFGDFGFEYPDSLLAYRGIIFQGLCHEELGALEDALVDYEDAVALREQFETDENGLYQIGPDEADLISGATRNRIELLTRLKRYIEAIGAADDFLKTTPDAWLTSSGWEVVAAKAEAEMAAGDISAASATAQSLVDFDSQGPAGRRGREILGRLPVFNLPPDKILRIAETTAGRGDFSRALDLCRRARETVKGARDEQEVGAASYFLAGTIYRWQNRLHEASLAYDCAAEIYPKGSRAPEALRAAVNCYGELNRRDKSRYYARRADERMNALATRYPQHPLAADAGIWQGLKLENDGDFAGAITFYTQIDPKSPTHHEASFRIANATYQQAKALQQQEGKEAEATALLKKAEELYRSSIELLGKAQEETLDSAVRKRLFGFEFSARMGLGTLLIELGKAGEVLPLIAGLEDKVGGDSDNATSVWSLRIQALHADGKVDEALRLFESLIQRTPDAPGIATTAGVLARKLDESAAAEVEKDPKRAEDLWRKAAFYYQLSVKNALAGTAALRSQEVMGIAQRLYVLGLFFNKVPEGQETFVDWQGPIVDGELWEKAVQIYEKLDQQAPSYRVSLELARTLAILGEIPEAETLYARLFDQVSLFTPGDTTKKFDRSVVEARPELVSAYLEWGVATHMVGLGNKDQGRLDRAQDIYDRVLANTSDKTRPWWQAKYFQIQLMSDQGQYKPAQLAINSTKRTQSDDFDKGEFGFKDKFKALEAELKKKVF